MIPFHIPQAHDACWVRPLLEAEGLPLCNYSFPVLFCWQDTYGFRYAPMGRRLLVQMKSSHAGNRPIPSSREPGQDIPR